MTKTDQPDEADFNHFLNVILGYKQKDHEVWLAFQKNCITEVYDLLCMSEESILALKYNTKDDKNKTVVMPLPSPFAWRLIQFKQFVLSKAASGHSVTANLQALTKKEFQDFFSSTETAINPPPSYVPIASSALAPAP